MKLTKSSTASTASTSAGSPRSPRSIERTIEDEYASVQSHVAFLNNYLSYSEIAKLLRTTPNSVRMWRNGNQSPTPFVRCIVRALSSQIAIEKREGRRQALAMELRSMSAKLSDVDVEPLLMWLVGKAVKPTTIPMEHQGV